MAQTDLSLASPTTTTPTGNADPGEVLYNEITSYAALALPNGASTESESNLSTNYFAPASLSTTSPTVKDEYLECTYIYDA